MPATSTLNCPFRLDAATGLPVTCEGATCASWNSAASECLLLQAAIVAVQRARLAGCPDADTVAALPNRASLGL